MLGLLQEAEASFGRATTMTSPTLEVDVATEAYFQLGKLARDNGNFAKAVPAYRQSVKLAPTAPGAHIMLGVTLRELERVEESLAAYTTGLAIQPAISAAQYNRAQALLAVGREAEALAGYRVATRLDPAFSLAYEALGDGLVRTGGRDAEASRVLRLAAELQPRSANAYYSLGKQYFNLQRIGESIAAHRAALRVQPDFAYVHNDIGNALSEATGRASEVYHHYSAAARLLPTFAEAWSNVGTTLKARTGRLPYCALRPACLAPRASCLVLQCCVPLTPLAFAPQERGSHGEAARVFERAIRVKPTLCEPLPYRYSIAALPLHDQSASSRPSVSRRQ